MSVTIQKIESDLDGIGHVLYDTKVTVPKYQRSYAWEERNVRELLSDVQGAIRAKEQEYFLGSVVIATNESGTPEVVDGQQRLATVAIILAAVRDMFAQRGNPAANDIHSRFLMTRDRRTQESVSNLRMNDRDHEFFVKRVLCEDATERRSAKPRRASHRRIARAAELAEEYVSDLAKTESDPTDLLHDLVDYLEKQVKVIVVQVPSYANAFTIFETLNDRGLDLALSDLLKNYLFHKAGDRLGEVQANWTQMYSVFESADNEQLVIDYIRQLWSSHHGLTRERELYDRIKSQVVSKQNAIDFSGELARSAGIYQAIINTDHEFWRPFGKADQHMASLNLLGITRIRPLVLAVLDAFTAAEVKKALKLMVSWAVRFMIVGGLGTGTLEEYYSERAKEIRKGQIMKASDLRRAMEKLVPSDEKFRTAYANANISKSQIARYVLRVLERAAMKEEQPELLPNENEEEVNLEHILPETPGPEWNIDVEVAEALHHRIGNLVLMKQRANVAAGNEGPMEKAKAYDASKLILTADVAKTIKSRKKWAKTEIEERQHVLTDLAVAAWSLRF